MMEQSSGRLAAIVTLVTAYGRHAVSANDLKQKIANTTWLTTEFQKREMSQTVQGPRHIARRCYDSGGLNWRF